MTSAEHPFGTGSLIADTSAMVRAAHPRVREGMASAFRSRQIATCSMVTLELLYSARDADEVVALQRDQALLRDVPMTATVHRAAVAALRELSERGPGRHRVSAPDALIAAAAQEAGIGVLHYDHHYDRLAEVLRFDSRWIAEPGSL